MKKKNWRKKNSPLKSFRWNNRKEAAEEGNKQQQEMSASTPVLGVYHRSCLDYAQLLHLQVFKPYVCRVLQQRFGGAANFSIKNLVGNQGWVPWHSADPKEWDVSALCNVMFQACLCADSPTTSVVASSAFSSSAVAVAAVSSSSSSSSSSSTAASSGRGGAAAAAAAAVRAPHGRPPTGKEESCKERLKHNDDQNQSTLFHALITHTMHLVFSVELKEKIHERLQRLVVQSMSTCSVMRDNKKRSKQGKLAPSENDVDGRRLPALSFALKYVRNERCHDRIVDDMCRDGVELALHTMTLFEQADGDFSDNLFVPTAEERNNSVAPIKTLRKILAGWSGSVPPVLSRIPSQNPNFCGHEQYLAAASRFIITEGMAPIVVLNGGAGVGKTSVMLQLAHLQQVGNLVQPLWFSAEESFVVSELERLASTLGLCSSNGDSNALCTQIVNKLANHPPWLLLVDNFDSDKPDPLSLRLIRELSEKCASAKIVISSRLTDKQWTTILPNSK